MSGSLDSLCINPPQISAIACSSCPAHFLHCHCTTYPINRPLWRSKGPLLIQVIAVCSKDNQERNCGLYQYCSVTDEGTCRNHEKLLYCFFAK